MRLNPAKISACNNEYIRYPLLYEYIRVSTLSTVRLMPRKPSNQPNDVELAILGVLWSRGPCTVRQVHEALSSSRPTGYTSTLKMMQVMVDKALLKRSSAERPQLYRPAVPEEQTQSRIVNNLIQKVFGGSAQKLVMRAVRTHRIAPAELREIRKLLESLDGDEP